MFDVRVDCGAARCCAVRSWQLLPADLVWSPPPLAGGVQQHTHGPWKQRANSPRGGPGPGRALLTF